MQPLLTQLLNLPGIEVESYSDLGSELISSNQTPFPLDTIHPSS